jgi:cobalt-zinc-cadmium efflux system outer membrane protein
MALGAAAGSAEPAAVVPSRLPDLDHLVALALERHPSLAAQRAEVDRLDQRSQSVALPEPMLTVAPFGEMAQTAAGEVRTMLSISQRFPGPGKLSAQVAEWQAAAQVAETGIREQAVAIALELRQAWWRWHEAIRAAEVTAQQQSLLEDLSQAIAVRIEANLAPSAGLLRIGVEIGTVEARLAGLRERALSAEAQLRALLALAPDQTLPELVIEPTATDLPPDLAAIANRLHPAILRSRAEAHEAATLARSAAVRRRPDFTLSASYNLVDDDGLSMAATGEDQWWIGAGISIPIWGGSYAAGERAAAAAARRATFRRLAAGDRIRRDLAVAAAAHAAAAEQYRIYNQRLLPQARQALEAERGTYAAGTGAFADLIMSARQLLDLELASIRHAHEMGLQHAALLAAAGVLTIAELEAQEADHD